MAKSVFDERTYITPSDSAGVAISSSPIEFVATCLNVRARGDDEDVAVLARQVDLAVGRHRRRAEAAADRRAGAGGRPPRRSGAVGVEDAVVAEDVEQSAVDERRRHVGAAAGPAPERPRRRWCSPLGSVRSPRAPARTTKIGRSGARPLAIDEQAVGEDRRRRRDLRAAAQAPQLLARPRVVAADEVRRVGDELGPGRRRRHRRRAPRRQLVALRLPHGLAGLGVQRQQERVGLRVALEDDEVRSR